MGERGHPCPGQKRGFLKYTISNFFFDASDMIHWSHIIWVWNQENFQTAFMKENNYCTFVANSRQKWHSYLPFFLGIERDRSMIYEYKSCIFYNRNILSFTIKNMRGLLLNLREHNSSETTKKSVFDHIWLKKFKIDLLIFFSFIHGQKETIHH